MKSIYSLNLCIAFFLLFVSPPLFCQGPEIPKKYSVNLTDEKIEKCIKLLPEFIEIGILSGRIKVNSERLLKLQKASVEIGFKNYDEYLKASSGLIMVYSYLQLQSNKKVLLEKGKRLNPEAKDLFKEEINSIDTVLKKYEKDISPESLKVVKKYIPQIDILLKKRKEK
jgi:hypothetical protein